MTSLDIGSGAHPSGNISIELYYPDSPHHQGETAKPTVKADAHHLPFHDSFFDTVYLIQTLEHLKCPYMALKEAHRVMTEKGILHVEVPEPVELDKRNLIDRKEHLYSWTPHTLKHLLLNVGFDLKTSKIEGFNQKVTARKMKMCKEVYEN